MDAMRPRSSSDPQQLTVARDEVPKGEKSDVTQDERSQIFWDYTPYISDMVGGLDHLCRIPFVDLKKSGVQLANFLTPEDLPADLVRIKDSKDRYGISIKVTYVVPTSTDERISTAVLTVLRTGQGYDLEKYEIGCSGGGLIFRARPVSPLLVKQILWERELGVEVRVIRKETVENCSLSVFFSPSLIVRV